MAKRKRKAFYRPAGVPLVIKGPQAEQEATERGIQFLPYTGTIRVTGAFFIRAGSVSIYRGYDLVAQWEDAVPGIRKVELAGMESVNVTTADQMLIASPYPVITVTQVGSPVVVPIINPSSVLGAGGYLSLAVTKNGNPDPSDYPWFYNVGSLVPNVNGLTADQQQVDQSFTRNFVGAQGSVQFRSSNSLAATNGGVAFQGDLLQASSASSRDRPFFHNAVLNALGGESTVLMVAFYEAANVAALWGFATAVLPANIVRSFYTMIPLHRGFNGSIEITAQMYAPGWIPAAGNGISVYGFNTNVPAVVALTYIHAVGICPYLLGTGQPRPTPFYIGLRSAARQ